MSAGGNFGEIFEKDMVDALAAPLRETGAVPDDLDTYRDSTLVRRIREVEWNIAYDALKARASIVARLDFEQGGPGHEQLAALCRAGDQYEKAARALAEAKKREGKR